MTVALVKISSLEDRIVPLGLACLQGYLKMSGVSVKTHNFRAGGYSFPKVIREPAIFQTNFVLNHQDFPVLAPIADVISKKGEVDLEQGIFPDLLEDYSTRVVESPSDSMN